MSNSNENDQDDYMSDDILNLIPDTRPGLAFSHKQLRKNELDKKKLKADELNREKFKKIHEIESSKRDEALLKSSFEQSNPGFNLMKKMGFNIGDSLGKSNNKGISEPIGIKIKSDRQGLGAEQEAKRKLEEYKDLFTKKQKLNEELNKNIYLNLRKEKFKFNKLTGYLIKLQKIVYQLDSQNDIKEPIKDWYWPKIVFSSKKTVNDNISEDEDNEANKLKDKLKTNKIYDEEDISDDLHDKDNEHERNIDDLESKINTLVVYLRDKYFYCFWCSVQYSNKDDISQNCPGLSEEDHDY